MTLGNDETRMWEELSAWLHNHSNLKGARMVLAMMNQWAETVNLFENLFGCAHEDSLAYSGEAGYPLVEAEIEMADAKTIKDCRQRLAKLEEIALARPLTQEEEEERRFIPSYLKEVSFRGNPRKFSDSGKRDNQRKLEALRYVTGKLAREHPVLAEYLRRHVQTSPVFRWI